jgi:hypothetical protein
VNFGNFIFLDTGSTIGPFIMFLGFFSFFINKQRSL